MPYKCGGPLAALLLVLVLATVLAPSLSSAPGAACSYVFMLDWGGYGQADGQFDHLTDVAVEAGGLVYATDMGNHRIQKFTPDGDFVLKWGSYGSGDGQFNNPHSLAIAPPDRIYVADMDNHRVQLFTGDGDFVACWGQYGSGAGRFNEPRGVAVGPDGDVYIADTGNHRVQKFTADGSFVAQWGSYGLAGGQFNAPWGVGVDADNFVYVADTLNHRIQKFTASGTFVTQWGNQGTGPGQFDWPVDVAVGGNHGIYIADGVNGRIQEFTPDGGFLLAWIVPKPAISSAEFDQSIPTGITLNADGQVYVANTWGNHIEKFAPWPSGLDHIAVQDAPGRGGHEVRIRAMTTSESLTVYAASHDACHNYLNDLSAAWATTGNLDSQTGTGVSFTFSPVTSQTRGTIMADDGNGHTGEAGPIYIDWEWPFGLYLPSIERR